MISTGLIRVVRIIKYFILGYYKESRKYHLSIILSTKRLKFRMSASNKRYTLIISFIK